MLLPARSPHPSRIHLSERSPIASLAALPCAFYPSGRHTPRSGYPLLLQTRSYLEWLPACFFVGERLLERRSEAHVVARSLATPLGAAARYMPSRFNLSQRSSVASRAAFGCAFYPAGRHTPRRAYPLLLHMCSKLERLSACFVVGDRLPDMRSEAHVFCPPARHIPWSGHPLQLETGSSVERLSFGLAFAERLPGRCPAGNVARYTPRSGPAATSRTPFVVRAVVGCLTPQTPRSSRPRGGLSATPTQRTHTSTSLVLCLN